MDEDSELLRKYADLGLEEAFGELVRRRMGLVYGAAFRQLGNVHAAQEVAQVVFTDLARKAKALKGRPILVSWLYTSTHYAVANVARRERRRLAREQEAYHMQDENDALALEADWERLRPVIDEALLGLDGRDREAVLLRFHEGRSFPEVGAALSLSEEAARKRVQRALESLRFRLSSKGITSSASALSALLSGRLSEAAPAGFADLVSKTAVVQAAGAGMAAAGLFTLVSAAKSGLGMAVLLALFAAGAAVYESSRYGSVSSALASSQAQYDAEAAKIGRLEGEVQEAQRANAPQGRILAAGVGGGGTESSPALDSKARGDAFMARHPEVKSALLEFVDATNRTHYGPLYASLGLSKDQMDQLEVLQRQGFTFGRSVRDGTVTLAASDLPSFDGAQAQIHALLGDQGFAQYQSYIGSVEVRTLASSLAGVLATTDSPLTPDQAQQVAGILADSAIKQPPFGFDWNAAYAKAQGVLNPAQLNMLQSLGTQTVGWKQIEETPH